MLRLSEASEDEDEDEEELPDPGPLEYLINYLSEIGEAEISGGHLSTIGWQTMNSWTEITGTNLTTEEALGVRRLSFAYVSQYYQAESISCPAPYLAKIPAREEIESKMKSLFSMLRGQE